MPSIRLRGSGVTPVISVVTTVVTGVSGVSCSTGMALGVPGARSMAVSSVMSAIVGYGGS